MVTIEKNGTNIKIDGIEIGIKEYNDRYGFYKDDENDIRKEYIKLSKEVFILAESKINPETGKFYSTEEYLKEQEKTKKVNYNLYHEAEVIYKKNNQNFYSYETNGGSFRKIGNKPNGSPDDETTIKGFVDFNNKKIKEFVEYFKEILPKLRQVFTQKEQTGNSNWNNDYNDPNKDKSREELGKRANEIEAYRKKVKGEIEAELNKDPKITNEDLEFNNKNWESEIWNTIIALGEKEIDNIKKRVISDIQTKRAIKKAEKNGDKLVDFKRSAIHDVQLKRDSADLTDEDLDQANHNWEKEIMEADNENRINLIKARVLTDIRNRKGKKDQQTEKQKEQAKDLAKRFSQATSEEVDKMEDKQLEQAMELFTRWEGSEGIKNDTETAIEIEKKLMTDNPELYRETIIQSLKDRMKDYGIDINEMNEEVKQVIQGEITDVNKVKEIKERAIKEIGEKGAKSKWFSWIKQAQEIIKKAKQNVTEQVKSDLKKIQKQLENFKSGTNSYLDNFYQKDNSKNKVDNLEQELNSCLNQTTNPADENKTPWGIIIPVSLAAISLIGIVAIIVVKKNRKNRVRKIME